MQDFDFHTHRPDTPAGSGIVCLPKAVVLDADAARWTPAPGGLYAAGIHPWWTQDADFSLAAYLRGLERLLEYPEVVQLGECGLDRLRGAAMAEQLSVFRAQAELSERLAVPMTLHCVRAFDLILQARKAWHPRQTWTIHGFRGGPALAEQLLRAGCDLSFGPRHNAEAWNLTPENRRHRETDAE